MEKIILSNQISLYKDTIITNKEELIEEINLNIGINHLTTHGKEIAPGLQSGIIINAFHMDKLLNDIVYKIKNQFNIPIDEPYVLEPWIYQSKKTNKDTIYHNHLKNARKQVISSNENDLTFTYYLQMPDNLTGKEGHITFGLTNSLTPPLHIHTEISFLPNEMELYVFSAGLAHKPEINPNSNIDRIVIAGNFLRLNKNAKYNKNIKTLF